MCRPGILLGVGVLNILNVLHGSLVMLGAYATFWLFRALGLDPFLCLPLTTAALLAFGYGLQRAKLVYPMPASSKR